MKINQAYTDPERSCLLRAKGLTKTMWEHYEFQHLIEETWLHLEIKQITHRFKSFGTSFGAMIGFETVGKPNEELIDVIARHTTVLLKLYVERHCSQL